MNLQGVNKETWVRSIMTVIFAVIVLAKYAGYDLVSPKEADTAAVVDAVVILVTAVTWAWSWWKNNSFTLRAQVADKSMAKK